MFSFLIGPEHEPSKFTVGGYVEDFYVGNISWHNISSNEFWEVPLGEIRVGDQVLDINTKKLVLDTGTSYALIPQNEFEEMLYMFMDMGFDCSYYFLYQSYGC